MTINKVTHYNYSRDHGSHPLTANTKTEREVTDHLFVISLGDESLMVTVADTGLSIVPTEDTSKGFSLDWDQVAVLVKSGGNDRDGVVRVTTESESTDDDEHVSRCGYCGDVIDYCQGHGEDERAEFGFYYDTDEYDERREAFEAGDDITLVEYTGTLEEFRSAMEALRHRAEEEAYEGHIGINEYLGMGTPEGNAIARRRQEAGSSGG